MEEEYKNAILNQNNSENIFLEITETATEGK